MKKSILLMTTLILSISLSGSICAAAAGSQGAKIVLTGANEEQEVKFYDSKFNGITLKAKMVGDELYLKADNSLPLSATWGYNPEINTSKATFNKDGKTDVVISMGERNYIDLQGQPQVISDTIRAELKNGYFPLRFVCELAGYKVDYDQETNTVLLGE